MNFTVHAIVGDSYKANEIFHGKAGYPSDRLRLYRSNFERNKEVGKEKKSAKYLVEISDSRSVEVDRRKNEGQHFDIHRLRWSDAHQEEGWILRLTTMLCRALCVSASRIPYCALRGYAFPSPSARLSKKKQ